MRGYIQSLFIRLIGNRKVLLCGNIVGSDNQEVILFEIVKFKQYLGVNGIKNVLNLFSKI